MFPSRELMCFHLTPLGWLDGDKHSWLGILYRKPAPDDQVLSVVSRTNIGENGFRIQVIREVWRSTDHARVIGLMARFGRVPPSY
jgi:hypothetical protein